MGMRRSARVASNATIDETRGRLPSVDELLRHLEPHHHAVRRTLRSMQVPDHELDNVADLVFDVAIRRWADFDGRDLAGWLRQIAKKKALSSRRKAWWRERLLFWHAEDVPKPAGGLDPEQAASETQRKAMLYEALRRITPKYATAVSLFDLERLSLREVAEHEGISEATAKTRVFRGRDELKVVIRKLMMKKGEL